MLSKFNLQYTAVILESRDWWSPVFERFGGRLPVPYSQPFLSAELNLVYMLLNTFFMMNWCNNVACFIVDSAHVHKHVTYT